MSVTGADVVRIARSELGKHEEPMGSNTGPFVIACQRATWLGGTGWPWCAAFVCKMCALLGIPLIGANSAGAHDLADRHKANKVWNKADWRPGMVVDYNLGSGHTGILTHIDLAKGEVTSCDGNFGDKVTEHTEPISLVRGVWAIPGVTYAAAPTPAPKPKRLPAFVVATSVNGTRKVLFTSATGSEGKKSLIAWMTSHSLAKLAPNGITIRRGPAR